MTHNKEMNRNNHCLQCCRDGCKGCGIIELTQEELDFLLKFAQLPFLPVASDNENGRPIYMEDPADDTNANSLTITLLKEKALIQVDYDIPLTNYAYSEYEHFPIHGSMALTLRGQQVIDQLQHIGFDLNPQN